MYVVLILSVIITANSSIMPNVALFFTTTTTTTTNLVKGIVKQKIPHSVLSNILQF